MKTIRQLIIEEIATRAHEIQTGSPPTGYQTDIGGNVFIGEKMIDETAVPYCVVMPGLDESTLEYGLQKNTLEINVIGVVGVNVRAGETGFANSEKILGDMVKCFTDRTWDRRREVAGSPVTYLPPYAATLALVAAGTPDYPEAGESTVGAIVSVKATYLTQLGNPYVQGGV